MQAKIDKHAQITITYNAQEENIQAPNNQKYLPCDGGCGKLLIVDNNVHATECTNCRLSETGRKNSTAEGDGFFTGFMGNQDDIILD
ncbi:MAG: hypothetical protein JRD89_01920 [Deltaproteobacteria bacterium]|nr:hypothetical protein [Deltaproteobacteria bacterium]